ncbi:Dabb family protein [Actinocorallia sp. API 0066]|uniref:Dabb family protein n=1 Tax=Actinocorallia sp. API 0066 TaxID=2896846 RepID=UPI001E49CCA4|nr:Dabb family protein [Actinocorallia sp. API 0066]MCD0448513.1 Dabb family protein [Actinocorallia sp. API 0066]
MIRHVVMFTWKPETTEAQRAAVPAGLAALPGQIPQIRRYEYGPGRNPGNKDFVLVADFDDDESFVTYRDHPAHQAFVAEYIAPIAADLARVQYEVG